MKTASRLAPRATVFGAVLLCSALGHAQSTQSTRKPAGPAAPDSSEVVQLTPFEVSTSKDNGYQATETLAGSRIRTDLRDVGSAISVATKEFMLDIGATDNQSLLQYMTSTEVGGPTGNFSGLGDDSVPNAQDSLLRPNGNTRVRGLDSADNTRDYYRTNISWDGYNTSRIDLLRGPNSILFGNGSGAGIINATPDSATFGRNTGTVEAKYGSFGSHRASLNFNQQLIPNQLAMRLAMLDDKKYYQQDPAYNHDRRYYGAVRFEPSFLKRDYARTTLKASFETGDIDANRPRTNTPSDGLFPWFLTANKEIRSPDGTLLGVIKPMKSHAGYDPFVTAITDATLLAANPTRRDIGARAALGTANANNSEAWLGRGTFPGIAGWQNGGFGAIFADPSSTQISYYLPQAPGPFYNAISSTGVRDGTVTGMRNVDNAAIVRLDQYSILGVGGRLTDNDGFLYERQGVFKNLGMQDPSVFNFYKKLMDGPNKKEASKFNAFNVQLEQTFWKDRVGFQAAYDNQTYKEYQINYLNSDSVVVLDVYRFLPMATLNAVTGLFEPVLNPNFGRPFVAATPGGRRTRTERETRRFTPFVDLNAKDLMNSDNLLTKIIGRHTFTGLWESERLVSQGSNFQRFAIDPNNAAALSGPNQGVNARRLATVTYIGPSLAGATTPAGANLSNVFGAQQVVTGPANYFDATYRTGAPAAANAWTMTAGLAPNQTGTSTANTALFEAENPANYNGWGSPTTKPLTVVNAQTGGEVSLTTSGSERRDETKSKAIVDQWKLLNGHLVLTGGLRRDKIETFFPGNLATTTVANLNGNRSVPNVTGAVDYTAPYDYSSTPTRSYESETLKTWSIVGHSPDFINQHLPFGLRLSAFYNHSQNFRPQARVGVLGDPISPPLGVTKDYGFGISALEGRVSLRVNRYVTNVKNASLNDNQVLTTTGDEVDRGIQFAKAVQNHAGSQGTSGNGQYAYRNTADANDTNWYAYQPATGTAATWTTKDWQDAEAQAQAQAKAFLDATLNETKFMSAWNIHPEAWTATASNFNMGHSTPGGAAVTGDTQSSGTEIELFVRPTDQWSISMNGAHTHAKRLALAGDLSEWIVKRWELYSGPAGDVRWFGGGNGGGSTLPGAKPGDPIADYGRVRMGRNVWRWYNEYRAKEGTDVAELRPYRFNATTSYRFNGKGFGGERLKGVFVGGSYRWEDRNIIGFQVKEVTPALGASNPAIGAYDITKPFYGSYEKHFDLFAGYTRRIFKNIDWRIQANVRNAFEHDRLIPINTNPDGSPANVRIAYGPTWELTSRFEF